MDARRPVPPDDAPDRDEPLGAVVVRLLAERGVTLRDIAEVVYAIQEGYYPDLTLAQCLESVEAVIAKREVQHVLLTGIALDKAAEAGTLEEPLLSILREDEPLYGVDEVLALGITNVYGSIGLTNFGYLDKEKIGIIGRLNARNDPGRVHTFLDDLVAAVAAAAAARIAHNARGVGEPSRGAAGPSAQRVAGAPAPGEDRDAAGGGGARRGEAAADGSGGSGVAPLRGKPHKDAHA